MHDPAARPRRDGWHGPLEVLVDEATLARRVAALGERITADFAGRPLRLVGVLTGSFLFFADLVRAIRLPVTCDFLGISTYGDARTSSGRVRPTQDLALDPAGENILVVEDIVDSGLTLKFLLDHLAGRGAAWVGACALLDKPGKRAHPVPVDYVGFTIADHFVVGYGLDSRGRLRNVPFVGVVPDAGP